MLYLPVGGAVANVFLCFAGGLTAMTIGWTVWTWDQLLGVAAGPGTFRLTVMFWLGSALTLQWGIRVRFQRVLLFLDHERIAIQTILFGFKRRTTITLVAGSRAERITGRERSVSPHAIQVMGKEGSARFGNPLSTPESEWLLDRINGFLAQRIQASDNALRLGYCQAVDLPRDGQIRVTEDQRDSFEIRFSPTYRQYRSLTGAYGPTLLFLATVLVGTLGGFLMGFHSLLAWMAVFVGAVVGIFAVDAWLEELSRIIVQVTPSGITCRHQLFGVDLNTPQRMARQQIRGFHVRYGTTGNTFDTTLFGKLRSLIRTPLIPAEGWGIEVDGDCPLIVHGFADEAPARQACALIQSQLQAWGPASEDRSEEVTWQVGATSARTKVKWGVLVIGSLIGAGALFDPLLLWLALPVALTGLLMAWFVNVKGGLQWILALAGAMTGGVALWFFLAIVPFCMASWPIRQAGGRVAPYGTAYRPPVFGTKTECQVRFRGQIVTDATLDGLAPAFSALPGISHLDLSGARITDDCMRSLQFCVNPHQLALNGTQVGDELLPMLLGMTRLSELLLRKTNLSDQGLERLPELVSISRLDVADTRIGDRGLAHIAKMPSVRAVDLSGTQVTDAGLTQMSRMISLHSLVLDRTSVSDAGLVHLEPLTFLTYLSVKGTNVTDEGVAKFGTRMLIVK
ncbi:MAG: leucine-rich repeat domain-containing protein [Planctomycetales bacterium]